MVRQNFAKAHYGWMEKTNWLHSAWSGIEVILFCMDPSINATVLKA
jgi:hypothetical protein